VKRTPAFLAEARRRRKNQSRNKRKQNKFVIARSFATCATAKVAATKQSIFSQHQILILRKHGLLRREQNRFAILFKLLAMTKFS
jgi:hypothetical protein